MRSFEALREFAKLAQEYHWLRGKHPEVRANLIYKYCKEDSGEKFEEFICGQLTCHSWSYSGTAYGGDDESYGGEGRCYCAYCGADGDG